MLKAIVSGGTATTIAPGTPVGNVTPGSGAFTTLSSSTSYVATGAYGSQVALGSTGQGGRVDFRRGSDGANAGFIGMHTATSSGELTWDNSGTAAVSRIMLNGVTALFCKPTNNGSIGVGVNPTAKIHTSAGVATAAGAPMKFTAGVNLTVVENGAFEFDGTALYFTHTGVRRTITMV